MSVQAAQLRGHRARDDLFTIRIDLADSVPIAVLTAHNGSNGGLLWSWAFSPEDLIVSVDAIGVPSLADQVRAVTLETDPSTGCELAVVAIRRGADGVWVAGSSLGITRPLSPQFAVVGRSNVVTGGAQDINGDGLPEALVEARRYWDERLTQQIRVQSEEGREITPGVDKQGWVSIVDGATAMELYRFDKQLSPGPGPISGFATRKGRPLAVALLQAAGAGEEVAARVVARGATAQQWSRWVPVLADGGSFLDLDGGPGFVTYTIASVEEGVPTGLFDRVRVTALDQVDGRVRWQREWTGAVVQVLGAGGDVLVDRWLDTTLEKYDGATGRLLWKLEYPSPPEGRRRLIGDQHGDGFDDYLIPYAAGGPWVVSGATGDPASRPQYAGIFTQGNMWGVKDLNGDGADDAVVVSGLRNAAGPTVVFAFDGPTGRARWTAPILQSDRLEALSANLTSATRRDVVLYERDAALRVLSGATGELLWTYAY